MEGSFVIENVSVYDSTVKIWSGNLESDKSAETLALLLFFGVYHIRLLSSIKRAAPLQVPPVVLD